ncbi:hypothetical protein PS623_03714 [Pseudomonas fluorescens]|nr:hypothetical protein PS623_03714 [Pseudomonas fluorescens]
MGEGRQAGAAAFAQGLFGKGEVAFFSQLHQQRVLGQVGLHDDLARLFGAPGAAGDLHDQLGHALAGAEVAREQPAIGIEDRHQGNSRKMVALGEHLRADEDARLAALDGGEQVVHGVFARCAVAVHAQYREVREQYFQALFGALGAGTHWAQVDMRALGAAQRQALVIAAVVAAQHAGTLVHGHACIAARAARHPATVVAQQCRGKTAPVEEYQHLLAGFEGLADGLLQRATDAAVQRPAAHVEAQEARLFRTPGAVVHAQQAVTAGVGVVQALQRGRGRSEQNGYVLLMRAYQRQIAGVVAQALLLFI